MTPRPWRVEVSEQPVGAPDTVWRLHAVLPSALAAYDLADQLRWRTVQFEFRVRVIEPTSVDYKPPTEAELAELAGRPWRVEVTDTPADRPPYRWKLYQTAPTQALAAAIADSLEPHYAWYAIRVISPQHDLQKPTPEDSTDPAFTEDASNAPTP